MTKTILLTGATDGIGFETAKKLVGAGHTVLIHGRSDAKLADTTEKLSRIDGAQAVEPYRADLSHVSQIDALASAVAAKHSAIDVLINNAGVFKVPQSINVNGLDVRFVVNTIAPFLLTKQLLPTLSSDSRVVNLSSAAQAPVNLDALAGKRKLSDNEAYAQSKLALTMWSFHLAQTLGDKGPLIVAVNPASLLASKMVKDAYGVAGNDLGIGADILVRAALTDEFAEASGRYFDNDQGRFAQPHQDALNATKNEKLVAVVETLIAKLYAEAS